MSAPGKESTDLATIRTLPSFSMQSQPNAWKAASLDSPKSGTEIQNHDTEMSEVNREEGWNDG